MKVAKWLEQCILVDGYLRTGIYDLNRQEFTLVDKKVKALRSKIEGFSFDEIKVKLSEVEFEWFEYLFHRDFIQIVPTSCYSNFVPIEKVWKSPSLISHATIDIPNHLDYCLELLISAGCKHVGLVMKDDSNLLDILNSYFVKTDFFTVELWIENLYLDSKQYDRISKEFPVLGLFHFGDFHGVNKKDFENCEFNWVEINRSDSFKPIHLTSMTLFMEAQNYNVYFNQRLHFGRGGAISNCNKSEMIGLSIKDTNIEDLIELLKKNETLNKLAMSNKDSTDVCKKCEFRYQCIDTRVPKYRKKDNTWYFDTECSYNPFIAKWEWEEGFMSLSSIGVTSNEHGYSENISRIKKSIDAIWG